MSFHRAIPAHSHLNNNRYRKFACPSWVRKRFKKRISKINEGSVKPGVLPRNFYVYTTSGAAQDKAICRFYLNIFQRRPAQEDIRTFIVRTESLLYCEISTEYILFISVSQAANGPGLLSGRS